MFVVIFLQSWEARGFEPRPYVIGAELFNNREEAIQYAEMVVPKYKNLTVEENVHGLPEYFYSLPNENYGGINFNCVAVRKV